MTETQPFTSLQNTIGYFAYQSVRYILSGQCLADMPGRDIEPNDELVVAQDEASIYVSDRCTVWRFTRADGIHLDAGILPVPLLLGLHDGKPFAHMQSEPLSRKGEPVADSNPVVEMWNAAIASATVQAVDTGIARRSPEGFAINYHRLFDLAGEALILNDAYLAPFRSLGGRVRYLGSTPAHPVVALVDDTAIAVIMPMIADPQRPEDSAQIWGWYRVVLSAIRAAGLEAPHA